MENMFFKGLEKALNEKCYVKVFCCSLRYPVVRVERRNKKKSENALVAYAEGGNVLSTLNLASSKIIKEVKKNETVLCDNTLIDKVVSQGYPLHFYKLSNGQILATISYRDNNNYIPIKSVIADDIQTSFEMLDASLKDFDLDDQYDFMNFANQQIEPIQEYQRNLKQK